MMSPTSDKGKLVVGSLAVIALTAIVIVSILRDKIVNEPYNSINVIGRGTVQYEPDTAIITAAVNYSGEKTSGEIQQKYNALYKSISEKLQSLEDAQVDIYPAGSSLNPNYEYTNNEQKINSYTGNYQVIIKVQDIITHKTAVDRVLELANKEGLNQVLSVIYTQSNMDSIRSDAWLKAYEALEKNKQNIEDRTDIHLGDITNWYENIVSTGETNYNNGYYGGYPNSILMPQEYVLEINAGYRAEEKE